MQLTGVSVVIPAYNEEKYLPETLRTLRLALENSELPSEIIVVNNLSTDQTAEVAHALGARVISHEMRNISSVRNAGIRAAKYDLIVSIDADCNTPIDAINKIQILMASGKYIGGGLGLRLLTDKPAARIIISLIQFSVELMIGIRGAVFFFLKDEALAIGGFDEKKLVSEDSAFAIAMKKRAKASGKKFGLLKEVEITTIDRKDTSFATFGPPTLKLIKSLLGQKLTKDELGYWYDPKR